MLKAMMDNFLKQGFEAETNAQALSVQVVDEDSRDVLGKAVADYRTKADNCYRSAEELSGQLAKLPKAKKAPA